MGKPRFDGSPFLSPDDEGQGVSATVERVVEGALRTAGTLKGLPKQGQPVLADFAFAHQLVERRRGGAVVGERVDPLRVDACRAGLTRMRCHRVKTNLKRMKKLLAQRDNSPTRRHRWRVSPAKARGIQQRLAAEVRLAPLKTVSTVAGLDCAFGKDRVFAAVVAWDVERRRVVERRALSRPLQFPYVPGLLSFREAPALLAALRRLRTPVDALLCDGQGIAHPRRFGLACHLGVLLGLPALGCAKSRLIGDSVEPGREPGASSPLMFGEERLGTVLRTRKGVKPLFVSPGHLCDFDGAVDLVLRCGNGLRLPEPVRLADQAAGLFKRQRLSSTLCA